MNKKITYYLSKTQWSLLLISGLLLQPLMAQVTFPYHQDLTTPLDPSEISLSNDATWNENGILLTPAENSKFGAAILEGATFAAGEGLKIEFEFGMYGSSIDQGADGISFFLFDADAYDNNFEIGAKGEGLAYMYNRALSTLNSDDRKKGLSGAYLGIGFDAWGKFQESHFARDKRKNGLITHLPGENNKSHVTLRGAAGKVDLSGNGREVGFNGYPVLITRSTLAGEKRGAKLQDYLTDDPYTILRNRIYNYDDDLTGHPDNFRLNTPTLGLTPESEHYRKAFIELVPATTNGESDGYYVTVKIQHGNTIATIIDNYHYKAEVGYTENANASLNTDINLVSGRSSAHILDATPPTNFKIGFGASTGSYTNNHLIRNLRVEILNAAVAEDDFASVVCEESVEIAVLENDYAYEGSPAVADSEYIDKTSFRFIDNDGNPVSAEIPYVVSGVGSWSYDTTTGKVTFTPEEGFVGDATIMYDINGSVAPFNTDAYRSLPATITVNVEHCVCTAPGASGLAQDASVGITTLNRNSNTWLEGANQGVNLVLESSTKPFVITRVDDVSNITEPVEGMLVWETSTSSLNLYKASGWSTLREGCNKPVLRTNQ